MNHPTGRALTLLSLLQTHRFWSGEELSARLEVSQRTLRRDIDRLRLLGYRVDATPGVAGGYRLAAGSHLPPLLLDDDEAVAIALGLRSTAATAVEGMGDTSARALAKIEQVLPDRLRRRVGALHASVTPLQWAGAAREPVDPAALALLAQACRDTEQVRFDYTRRDGEEASRLVEPHHLVSAGTRWYLVAWDVRRDGWRTFRVDRLTDARLAGVRFTARPIPGGDPADFVRQSIGAVPQPHQVSAVLSLPVDEAREAVRWTGATVEPVRRDPSRSRVTFQARSLDWLAGAVAMAALTADLELLPAEDQASPDDLTAVQAHLALLRKRLAN